MTTNSRSAEQARGQVLAHGQAMGPEQVVGPEQAAWHEQVEGDVLMVPIACKQHKCFHMMLPACKHVRVVGVGWLVADEHTDMTAGLLAADG